MPKKVLHVIIGLNIGGAELMLKRLVLHSQKKGEFSHEVISLTDLGIIGAELQKEGVNVYTLGMQSGLGLPTVFIKLKKLIKKLNPDIVQTWMYHADFLGGLAAKSVGKNSIVWNIRNTYLSGRGLVNLAFRNMCLFMSYFIPKQIIYVSNSAKDQHIKSGYNKKLGRVVYNGFDINKFKFNTCYRLAYRAEIGLKDQEIAVFSVGRCSPAKDHLTFIKAIMEATKINPNIKGVIVGRDFLANSFDLTTEEIEKFIILGQRNDVDKLLSAADIFCLHSKTEGFPNVLGEAMSVGLPSITTKAGDAELILNNQSYTYEVGDYLGIANAIVILAQNSEERQLQGEINRKRVQDLYVLENVINDYEILYKAML